MQTRLRYSKPPRRKPDKIHVGIAVRWSWDDRDQGRVLRIDGRDATVEDLTGKEWIVPLTKLRRIKG
jgi:hypothetical protein